MSETELTDAVDFFTRCDKWVWHDGTPHWLGQMLRRALRDHLNRHYPRDVFPTLHESMDLTRDYGPRAVSALRQVVGVEEE